MAVAREAMRTLRFSGREAALIADVGVAGLWRLMRRLDELRQMKVLIVAAGMDAALPSVVGGLVGRRHHRGADLRGLRRRSGRPHGAELDPGELRARHRDREHR